MRIGTFNVRGLRDSVKNNELFSFFINQKLDMCCVQETKAVNFFEKDGNRIWKNMGLKWCLEGTVGRSGGILTFWNEESFICSSG